VEYTPHELLTVLTAREMAAARTVFAGVGIPLVAAIMAKRTHTPDLIIVVEGGSIDPQVVPGLLPISTNEMRIGHRAQMLAGITDVFLFAQRGFLDLGIIGGAQIDRFGNVNTTVLGPYEAPRLRLPGSGGANDIVSLCRRIILVTMHERRRFVPRVDFVTSPGYLDGGESRRQAGLIFGSLKRLITDLGIFGFDEPTRAMTLESRHPGATLEEIRDRTGFGVIVPDRVPLTDAPTSAELAVVRDIDPDRRYLRA
jgi:glutaconate CoA-transferase subunit B